MYSLLAAILSSSAIALLFKQSEKMKLNKYWVTFGNYVTASAIAFFMSSSIMGVTISKETFFIGIITGVFFLGSFVFYQYSVGRYGASVSGMYSKLGILVPMILSFGIFNEQISFIQGTGILVALLAIGLMIDPNRKKREVHLGLLGLFIVGGLSEFGNKVFQYYGPGNEKPFFLLLVFAIAGILCLMYIIVKRIPFSLVSMMFGIFVGTANLMSSYFLIDSLNVLPGSIAFPIFSAGAIAVISIGSNLLFKEQLGGRQKVALVVSMIALWLVNQ